MPEQIRPNDALNQAEGIEQNIREHLDLRLRFAEAVAAKKNVPLGVALWDYTDTVARVRGSFPGQDNYLDEEWKEKFTSLESLSREERFDALVAWYRESPVERKDHTKDTYWPFRFDYLPEERSIDLHFGNVDIGKIINEPGFLDDEREEEMRQKLTDMFAEIKQLYPQAKFVETRTWLFNKPEFLRLFPKNFSPDFDKPALGGFQGGGRWGQFYNKRGQVNSHQRDIFLANIKNLDPEHLENAFPLKTYEVFTGIEDFYTLQKK